MTARTIIEQEARLAEQFQRSPRILAEEVVTSLANAGYIIVERPRKIVGVDPSDPWGGERYRLTGAVGDELVESEMRATGLALREASTGVRDAVDRKLRHDWLHALGRKLGVIE